jgi:hypothetical protein
MDINIDIFKSPEISFCSRFGTPLISLIGVLISAGIAIYLFNRGLKKERDRFQYNRNVEKQDRIEQKNAEIQGIKDHILVLLESILRAVDQQIEEYLNKAFEIFNNPHKRLIVNLYTHENLKRLLSIDSHKIWEVFSTSKIENKHYYNLYACLDYFNNVFKKVQEDVYEGNGQVSTNLMNDLIKIRNNILDVATNYIFTEKRDNIKFDSNPFWVMINKIIIDYYYDNDGIPDIHRDYTMIINKFKIEMLKEQFKYHPVANEILKLCKIGGDTYFSINQINKELARDIISVSEHVQDMSTKLSEILEILKRKNNNNSS